MGNIKIFDHPLIQHKTTILRQTSTTNKEFRELVEEITTLMTYESLKDGIPTTEVEVQTPLEKCTQTIENTDFLMLRFLHVFINFRN